MKQKGFTLIELLAVIIILAVIALIATPIVLNVVDNAKRSSFKNSANGIVDSAKLYQTTLSFENKTGQDVDLDLANDYPEGFGFQGEKPNGGQVIITKNGQTALAIYNNNYCALKYFSDSDIKISDYTENECVLKKVSLTGKITDSRNLNLKIKLMSKDSIVQEVEPVNDTYQFSDVMLGVYDIVVVEKNEKQYLKNIIKDKKIENDSTLDITTELLIGDINQDNIINVKDIDYLTNCYNKKVSDNSECELSDLNNDGLININDRAIISGNYQKISKVILEGTFTLKGKLTYASTNIPTISLKNKDADYEIELDSSGNFILEDIPKGSYTLYIGKTGSTYYRKWFNIYDHDIEINYQLYLGNVVNEKQVCDEITGVCTTNRDSNNRIDGDDIKAIEAQFGTTNKIFDLDNNGIVNASDLAIAIANNEKTGFEE